jgi:kynureninase
MWILYPLKEVEWKKSVYITGYINSNSSKRYSCLLHTKRFQLGRTGFYSTLGLNNLLDIFRNSDMDSFRIEKKIYLKT